MKLQKHLLAALAVCLLLGSSAMAATKVTLSNVHLCCGKCEVGANKALATVDGAKGKVDRKAGTIAITASDAATAQKALDALAAAGYHGSSDNDKLAIKDDSGAKGKTKRIVLTGVHNCCGGCGKAITKACNSVDGVQATALKAKATTFVVEGDFDATALIQAIYKAGFHATVKK